MRGIAKKFTKECPVVEQKLAELKARLLEVDNINAAASVLSWDQSTYMPPGGAQARARQLATLQQLSHQKFTDPAIGRLLDDLQAYAESLPYDHDDAALIRVTRREYERATKIPQDLVAALSAHISQSYAAWVEARPANDWARMVPLLEKTVELSRRIADCFPGYEHPMDPLIEWADPGMTVATIRPLFAKLRDNLVPLVEAITAHPPADDSCLHRTYPEDRQREFGERVIRAFGYDFNRGRQDKTAHPFMIKFSIGDVRITTRFKENDLSEGLFSTLHEAGHALYEQNVDWAYEGTPLANGASSGVHESQSRLWENLVGRSRPFWEHYYPHLQATFPEQLGDVSLDTFYRAINKVQRSLIRTDADEVTYNLHVLIRFDLEAQLLEGSLAVKDLRDAWNARYESDLGITPPDDAHGVLQDVHWFGGVVGGAFQGYTLGNIMSAQIFNAAVNAHPSIPDEIRQGQFETLRTWLTENIYRHGAKFLPLELIERATGKPLDIADYIAYLRRKYGELYPEAVKA
ncbi:carboxypeptidase [Ardenticatena maritima]|uniref:Metal-dependent carboxypeptidase n=1 Tax=Ardenticatena maritima TaxID=872965 RepID=A0A0P6YX39_9CHLR|nr:carboxypeptidase [Ardenticatena maritima]